MQVMRAQLDLAQVRQEIDRRIQEKEEEFENTRLAADCIDYMFQDHKWIMLVTQKQCLPIRKNHARALDSMQASLEAEARAKAEALRIKKKLETVCWHSYLFVCLFVCTPV